MLPSLDAALRADLDSLMAIDRYRQCPAVAGLNRQLPVVDGTGLVSFCSNDYLGLANHPALATAAAHAAATSGFGASASRLVSGDFAQHRQLETEIAAYLGTPAALLFPTGYQANLGTIAALAGREDVIVSDRANHASLIDGCRLSRAQIATYPHGDVVAAGAALAGSSSSRRRFLVTESLFSMEGDLAPLAALAQVAARHEAALIVDEAHALGVMGPGGRGLCHAAGITPDVLIGTLGKAFGTMGGFVAGTATLRTFLINRARTFIFTTASPPPLSAASLAAVQAVRGPDGDARRAILQTNIRHLERQLGTPRKDSPIFPIVLGSDDRAVAAAQDLRRAGLFVQAIRPPTVPEGSARLRVTVSAAHTVDQMETLIAHLRPLLNANRESS